MLKNDGCDVASDDSAFPYAPNAGAPGALFPPLFPPSAIPSAPFASSPPPISSSTPLFSYSHRQRFPLDKTPKDERLLSADAATFDGPSQFQLGVNGSAVAFPSAQFATTAQRPNLCHQRSAQSAVAAQMAHAMAQQLVSSVYVPNLSSSSSSAPRLPDTVRNSQHQPQQQKQSFDCPVVVPTHSHQQQQQQQQYPFVPNCAVPSAVFVPFCAAGTVPHCANSASTSSQQLYEPNFVPSLSVPAPAPLASRAGASSPSSSGGPSSASSLSGAYSSSASANCGMPSGAAAAAMFFPQLYSVNNSGNDFYAYYAQQHNHHHHSSLVSQCHHQHPFLHHLGGAVAAAAATVPQPQPPVLLASNGCSAASSASNCSELEHGGASAAHQLASGVGASWRGTTTTNEEERRTKLMATIGGVAAGAAASRRAESGTFPGLCPQPRHPVGPGTNNVRVRTKDTYRVVYSECQRQELEQEFDNGGTFITRERKAALSARLRLTERQIKIWFQNRRAKERRRNGRKGQNPTVDF